MKKLFALVLTAALLAALFTVGVSADYSELVDVLMSSEGVQVSNRAQSPDLQALEEAIEEGTDRIPAECKLVPGRVSLMRSGDLSCDKPVYNITFRVWSTRSRTIALLFQAEGSDSWELVCCSQGEIIEGRFESSGSYAIVVGW